MSPMAPFMSALASSMAFASTVLIRRKSGPCSPALGPSSAKKFAAMGASVAPEIRGAVLGADGADTRMSTVEVGLADSLRRLRKIVALEEKS